MKHNKNLLLAGFLTGSLLIASPAVFAHDHPNEHVHKHEHTYLQCFTHKLGVGLMNTATGFIELPKNIINISSDENILVGLTWGTIRGAFHTVGRTVVGAAEFLTAPFPSHHYTTPPLVWDRFSEDTRYFGLHLPGFWTTYGPLDDGDDD